MITRLESNWVEEGAFGQTIKYYKMTDIYDEVFI
jgi:hypothetical protein